MGKWSAPSSESQRLTEAIFRRLSGGLSEPLTLTEERVLAMRFPDPCRDRPSYTQQEIAAELGITQPMVSKIETRLLRKLNIAHGREVRALADEHVSKAEAKALRKVRAALAELDAEGYEPQ